MVNMDFFDPPPSYSSLFESTSDLTDVCVPKTVSNSSSNENEREVLRPPFVVANTRATFMSQVLNILLLQYLSLAHLLIMLVILIKGYPSVHEVVCYYNFIWIPASGALYLVTLGLLLYCTEARWRKPQKYMFLVAYPLTLVVFLSAATAPGAIEAVSMGGVYFSIVTVAMKVYCSMGGEVRLSDIRPECTTRCAIYIFTAVLLVVMYACTIIFLQYSAVQVLCVIIVVFFQSAYTMVDLRAMMAAHRFDIGPEDYTKAALVLYIDYLYIIKKIYKMTKDRSTALIE